MAEPIRFVKELGLWAFSRGCRTCHWQTEWCARYCYNKKFYCVNPKLGEVDRTDEKFWQETDFAEFAFTIPKDITRFRFAIRGEIWTCLKDVLKVHRILKARPEILFWIPTRAWQPMNMMEDIEDLILPLPNARVMASMDPTTTLREERVRQEHGWSTVFAGDNADPRQMQLRFGARGLREKRTASMVRCEKTWEHHPGACAVCENGCFNSKRVDVHLRQHR